MMVPVRCFTCGTIVASAFEVFRQRVESEGSSKAAKILDELGITRTCCRRMIISHTDLIDDVAPYG